MDEAFANFQDQNDNGKVINSVLPKNGSSEPIVTAFASNCPSSLIMTERTETYQFAHTNLNIPIDVSLEASGIDQDSILCAGEINNLRWQGNLNSFLLPTGSGNTGQYFIHKTVLADAGLDPEAPISTWWDLTQASAAITQKDDFSATVMGAHLGVGVFAFGRWPYTNVGRFRLRRRQDYRVL